MRIAVLGSASSWYVKDLKRAAADQHEVFPISYSNLSSLVSTERVDISSKDCDLCEFDSVLVRSMPPGSLEQVIFRMNALAQLSDRGIRVVNSPRAIEIAVDKYLTTAKLQQASLRVPSTITCQTVEDAMAAFVQLDGDVVVKPIFGSEGRGIVRLTDAAIALRTFKSLEQIGSVIYVQEFIPHYGYDIRLLVIGIKVFGMRRSHPTDWRTNLSRGASAEKLEVTAELAEIAYQAASAVQAEIVGIDLLPGIDGNLYVLEANAVPGWRGLAKALNLDVAKFILNHLSL